MDDGTRTITATEFKANLGKYLDCVIHDGAVVIRIKIGRRQAACNALGPVPLVMVKYRNGIDHLPRRAASREALRATSGPCRRQ